MQKQDMKQELLQFEDYKEIIDKMVDLQSLSKKIKELDQETFAQDFWSNQEHAQTIIKQVKQLKKKKELIDLFYTLFDEVQTAYELCETDDDEMSIYFEKNSKKLESHYQQLRVFLLLNGELDDMSAVLEIHPGAGGTESQDWADMLYRMYKRYAEQKSFQLEILDYQSGEEAGIKSVTFGVKGDYAYGYLKSEHGVHRLVRISPFDSGGRRHTSFASVNVIPEIDDSIEIDLEEKDLKIDTYRSSGAGGQSVNTTDSAVRITHLPTNTVVTVQNERSQIKNRDKALSILKSKLYQIELEKKKEELDSFRSTNVSNSFGSQIRSYVMHPYSMIKDHRTNIETGNVSKVMDGYLDEFIEGYLIYSKEGEQND